MFVKYIWQELDQRSGNHVAIIGLLQLAATKLKCLYHDHLSNNATNKLYTNNICGYHFLACNVLVVVNLGTNIYAWNAAYHESLSVNSHFLPYSLRAYVWPQMQIILINIWNTYKSVHMKEDTDIFLQIHSFRV